MLQYLIINFILSVCRANSQQSPTSGRSAWPSGRFWPSPGNSPTNLSPTRKWSPTFRPFTPVTATQTTLPNRRADRLSCSPARTAAPARFGTSWSSAGKRRRKSGPVSGRFISSCRGKTLATTQQLCRSSNESAKKRSVNLQHYTNPNPSKRNTDCLKNQC